MKMCIDYLLVIFLISKLDFAVPINTLLSVTHTCALSLHCRRCDICNLDSHDCHHMSILNSTHTQVLVQSGCTIGVVEHPWDCQGCHHGNMALETGGQRLTTSETTLNVQGSSGTEGGYGQVRDNLLGQRRD